MATSQPLFDISRPAGADLSTTGMYRAVKLSGANVVQCSAVGELAVGILQNSPIQSEAGSVRVLGISKAEAGGVIAVGDVLKTDAQGRVIVANKAVTNTNDAGSTTDPLIGSNVLGIALEAASGAGIIITILVLPMGAVPTTAS